VARRLRAGMVQANGAGRAPGSPFGGVKQSGNGPAWEIWRSLRLPDHVVVDWPGLRRIEG
jgi:acyl-CoA reductase-like NAD-dependent aldehyde dehydrogenase